MTRVRLAGLTLVATFAIIAIATAPAYASKNPTLVNSKGEAVKTVFTSKSTAGSAPVLQPSEGGSKVECNTETSSGSISSSTVGELRTSGTANVIFTGCTSVAGKCKNTSTAGEIKSTVSLLLVWIGKESSKTVGELLAILPLSKKPGNGEGGKLKFECATTKVEVEGSFVAPVKQKLEESTTIITLLAKQKEGAQEFTKYTVNGAEGTDSLYSNSNGSAFAKAGEEVTDEAAYKESVKLDEDKIGVETESGWSAEASSGGEFDITSNSKVTCEKETFSGVSPSSGFSTTSDMAPTYSGCQFEVEKESKVTKTKAEVKPRGCDLEYSGADDSSKGKFTSEFDISKCTGAGIQITSELEAGKTCEVNIPDQATAKEDDEDSDTKEGAPFGSESKIDATDVKGEVKECPEEIEKGKEPQPFFVIFIVVPRVVFIGLYFFILIF
jgi:hypothetical protein